MYAFLRTFSALLLYLTFICAHAQDTSQISKALHGQENIRLNQVGFYPNAPKCAVITRASKEGDFYLKPANSTRVVFTGKLSSVRVTEVSGKPTRIADFSAFRTPGTYRLEIPGVGQSYPFEIKARVHQDLAVACVKGLYYQRASTDLSEEFAGKWHRLSGNPDTCVLVHASAATAQRPSGTVISAPRGWHDAGDYNKYIVASGITMGTLLSAYEDFPQFYRAQNLNIPESTNEVPDLLDEVLWNLRWMLAMQDPADGGVYHKLTTPVFDKMVMPHQTLQPRYVVQKGTGATLDFAAVMAQASRVYGNFPKDLPGLSDSCLTAATRAWEWAKRNPRVEYDQGRMNMSFDPDIRTGPYMDSDFSDNFIWAAAELYTTTLDEAYYKVFKGLSDDWMPIPSWQQVRSLGYYTLLRNRANLTPLAKQDIALIRGRLLREADAMVNGATKGAYGTVMGRVSQDFIWGSNSVAANQGIALVQAYRISNEPKYLKAALSNLDYLLGRNALGYCFVTGFGERTTMNLHHGPSVADGIREPVPGLLSGGPNGQVKKELMCGGYTATSPDEMYLDAACSYTTNEVAICWNAPLAYLVGAMEMLQQKIVGITGKTN